MIGLFAFRQVMMRWNLFIAACIFVAGLLLKVGAPASGVALGIGVAAAVNAIGRRRAQA